LKRFVLTTILVILFFNQVSTPVRADVQRTITFKTAYGTTIMSTTLTIPSQTLSYWKSLSHPPAITQYQKQYVIAFSHYVDTASVSSIAQSVASRATLGEEDVADTVLSFVQNVGYVLNDYTSQDTLYPTETLAEGGVCDDLSVLYGSMMVSLGFQAAFVWYPKQTDLGGSKATHVNVALHLSIPPTHTSEKSYWSFDVQGTAYYVAETTRDVWMVGDLPEQLTGQSDYLETAPSPTTTFEIQTSTQTRLTFQSVTTEYSAPSTQQQIASNALPSLAQVLMGNIVALVLGICLISFLIGIAVGRRWRKSDQTPQGKQRTLVREPSTG
jgi:hypothetical protein